MRGSDRAWVSRPTFEGTDGLDDAEPLQVRPFSWWSLQGEPLYSGGSPNRCTASRPEAAAILSAAAGRPRGDHRPGPRTRFDRFGSQRPRVKQRPRCQALTNSKTPDINGWIHSHHRHVLVKATNHWFSGDQTSSLPVLEQSQLQPGPSIRDLGVFTSVTWAT